MVNIYDWYIMGVCVLMLGIYILLTWLDEGNKK